MEKITNKGRILESVSQRGAISGIKHGVKPDMFRERLERDVQQLGREIKRMEEGDPGAQPLFIKFPGTKAIAMEVHAHALLDYIGVRGELSFIEGNVREVNQELDQLVQKYLPDELKEQYDYHLGGENNG
jgi:hypothetical protein